MCRDLVEYGFFPSRSTWREVKPIPQSDYLSPQLLALYSTHEAMETYEI